MAKSLLGKKLVNGFFTKDKINKNAFQNTGKHFYCHEFFIWVCSINLNPAVNTLGF